MGPGPNSALKQRKTNPKTGTICAFSSHAIFNFRSFSLRIEITLTTIWFYYGSPFDVFR